MKMLIPAVGALTLALALPQPVEAQARGPDHGKSAHDRGRGPDRAKGPPVRRGPEARRPDRGRDARPEPRHAEPRRVVEQRRQEVRQRANAGRDEVRRRTDDRRREAQRRVEKRRDDLRRASVDRRHDARRDREREAELRRRLQDRRNVAFFRASPERHLIAGCPPGLARKNNGCLPPGQARKIAHDHARWDYLWDRRDVRRYRYDDGYLYRYDTRGVLQGWAPVLGGALGPGSVWPTQYRYEPAPTYVVDYYRLPDRYDYRYADGVLYGLDPQTQAISQVAALLTGQQWNVGQAMPAGYDIYNVPYGYRDRYYDTPDRWYRYSDGYVYQVDPTTQLVQAVVQLLT